ncbi:pentatricopeptide repeat-containing protein At2g17210 [Phoenix dactylifera]|uniref:Pentatricopeptide repeat-containing protein At2g17210 n=1 Tax=Phoenix dactylifera TaxID=42345 RepID=A0A8B7BM61_PHODC|nr:pentatricopeptide repeat-containing protein At2g17210 [Phoenix dactylifera]
MRISLGTTLLSYPKIVNRDLLLREFASRKQWQEVLLHYHKIRRAALPPHPDIIPPIFKACASLQSVKEGISIHADVIKMGFESCTSISNTVMSFYIKCGMTDSAMSLFDDMMNKDSVSWNVIIHGFLSHGEFEAGLSLFNQAKVSNFEPNVSTLVLVTQACWKLDAIEEGWNVHGLVIKNGFSHDVEVQNSMLCMYAKCRELVSARRLFDEMGARDVISWSALISGYAQSGEAAGALQLFREMSNEGTVDIDGLAVVSVLQACGGVGDIKQGRSIHGHLIRRGFEADLFVGNALVDMYSKCHDVGSATMAFNLMPHKNTVSWNSILAGLVQNEKYMEALSLFDLMRTGVESDEVTLVALLRLCKKLGQAFWCKCIHAMVIRRHFVSNELLLNSLLDAYAKCDLMELALKLFRRMKKRNVISWSVIMAGFAHCGKPDEAVAFFSEMQLAKEKPNSVTILSLFEACAVSAELKLSKCAHGVAIRNGLVDDLVVDTTLLDMYAKCGDLNASKKVFQRMPERSVSSWNAMIGALGMNGRPCEALATLHEMESDNVKPNGVTMLAVLSACRHGGLVEEGFSYFQRMLRDPLLQPSLEHYSCVVDMLGRAGDLVGALEVIKSIPDGLEAGPAAWGALLSACRSHGNYELGRWAASRVLELEPFNSAGYLLTSSMYAKGGSIDGSAKIRLLMKEKGMRIVSGYSVLHVGRKAHKFVSWDGSHPQSKEIYSMVELLHSHLKWTEKHDCLIT